jgi:ribonuclease HI
MGMLAKTFLQLFPAPGYHMTLFVDDLALQVSHNDFKQCLHNFAQAGAWVISELQDALGLPIERDKTFILGTSEELARAARNSAGDFGGTAVTEVRKLGATYSHQHRKTNHKKKGVVRGTLTKDRVARALHRTRRVQSLAGTRAFGTVYQTGMLPEATFGASVSLLPPHLITRLRTAAVKAHGLQTVGVHHKALLLAIPPERDPQWHVDKMVLETFAREVWNLERRPHIDHLTRKEIGSIFGLPAPPEYQCFETAWKDPIATLHYTLRRHQITWIRPTTWAHGDQELELTCGTPAMLLRLLKPAFRQTQVREAKFPGTSEEWDPTYLHHVLDSTGTKRSLSLNGKKALLSFMMDRYPTRSTLARWGYVTDGMCPHCNTPDTAYHRIHTCNLATMATDMHKHLRRWRDQEGMARGILHIEPPARPEYDHSVRYTLFGKEVTRDQFGSFMSVDGPVYTDGSSLHGRTPFAVGGWAALQVVNGNITRSISAPNPPNFPQTSDFAEHIALHITLMHASDNDPVHIVTDCASVISYYHKSLQGTANEASNPLGGVWDDMETQRIERIDKIKSHLTYAQACERNMGQWWQGNQLVDRLAQEAAKRASISEGESKSYLTQLRWAEQYLRDIAKALLGWGGEASHPRDFEKLRTTASKSGLPSHSYEWCHTERAWICTKCWKHRQHSKAQVPDRTGCKAIPIADIKRLHPSHEYRFAQGPWGSKPLMFCTRCGQYSRRRLAGLAGWCKGSTTPSGDLTSAYRLYLRTIRRGRHPTIPKYSLGHQYSPTLSFSPLSDSGSFETDLKAAYLCLLKPPPKPPEEALIHSEVRELEELEREAAEAEASLRQRAAALAADEGGSVEEEAWFSHDLDFHDP